MAPAGRCSCRLATVSCFAIDRKFEESAALLVAAILSVFGIFASHNDLVDLTNGVRRQSIRRSACTTRPDATTDGDGLGVAALRVLAMPCPSRWKPARSNPSCRRASRTTTRTRTTPRRRHRRWRRRSSRRFRNDPAGSEREGAASRQVGEEERGEARGDIHHVAAARPSRRRLKCVIVYYEYYEYIWLRTSLETRPGVSEKVVSSGC